MSGLSGNRLGPYHIIEKIGRGGMATVFKARNIATNQIVAIKVLVPQLALQENFKERFKREAQVLQDLKHPNIVPILDYGESGGFTYIVMPLMEVGGLDDRLSDGPLQLDEGVRVVGQIASALQFAHDNGVIHRDVKPSNILIDEDGNAWLSDFGFAHVQEATVSLTGSALIGTPAYMAPEQVLGEGITRKTDQYALGVVLFQVCTGHLPFDSETPMAIALKHAADPLPRPRSVNPNLPDAVEWVLIKALSKDPDLRYGSINELFEAFRDAIHTAIDVRAGVVRGGARSSSPVEEEFRRTGRTQTDQVETNTLILGQTQPRRSLPVLLLLLLLIIPLAAFAGFRLSPDLLASASNSLGQESTSGHDLEATIAVLSTANAPREGTAVTPGQVQTAVAATLTAMSTDSSVIATEDSIATPEVTERTSASPTVTDVIQLDEGATSTVTVSPTATPTEDTTPSTPGGPTPTITVTMTQTQTPTPTLTGTVTPTLNPTDATLTAMAPTTETYTPTTLASLTFTPTPTKTLTMTKTPTKTKTMSPTPSMTVTTVSPTSTTVTPTYLPTKTPSSTTPTFVKTPTTEAVVTDPCDGISLGGFQQGGDTVQWKITNDSGSPIYIIAIVINWPSEHQRLNKVWLRGNPIWTGSEPSPTVITFSDLKPIRKIDNEQTSVLKFLFMKEWNGLVYGLGVRFHQGCDIARAN
jgi:serine/threonine protein kinase